MMDYRPQIARHSEMVNRLNERVKATVKTRGQSAAHHEDWEKACRAFQGYRSTINSLLEDMSVGSIADHNELRAFVFDFLSVDPVYFRSGYLKERMLRSIRTLELRDSEKCILQQTICRRIHTHALREFRHFCRLIPRIQTEEFVDDLRTAAGSEDGDIRRRAAFALRYAAS